MNDIFAVYWIATQLEGEPWVLTGPFTREQLQTEWLYAQSPEQDVRLFREVPVHVNITLEERGIGD